METNEMDEAYDLESFIRQLVFSDRLAVLSTCAADNPHASLIAFEASNDLKQMYFVTLRTSKKYCNLASNPQAALLIDNSTNREADFHAAAAVTVTGQARELAGQERTEWSGRFVHRHPYLKDFVASPSCAIFVIEIDRYRLVRRFQNVMEFVPQ
jgi:nitroimidazol reductase NimA-like FMN-containing flavoprotein (pyridoxamine 5'-phosphate oxidase superfamily)